MRSDPGSQVPKVSPTPAAGVAESRISPPLPECGSQISTPFPGCVLRTTRRSSKSGRQQLTRVRFASARRICDARMQMEQPSPSGSSHSHPSRLGVIPISPSQKPHAKARSRQGGRNEPSPRHALPGAVTTGAEHRKMIAQRVSAGLRPQKSNQPRQGRQNLSADARSLCATTPPSDPPDRQLPP